MCVLWFECTVNIYFVVNANLFQHGVCGGQRGEDGLVVGGAEESRDPEEKTADEFRGQDEEDRGFHPK